MCLYIISNEGCRSTPTFLSLPHSSPSPRPSVTPPAPPRPVGRRNPSRTAPESLGVRVESGPLRPGQGGQETSRVRTT